MSYETIYLSGVCVIHTLLVCMPLLVVGYHLHEHSGLSLQVPYSWEALLNIPLVGIDELGWTSSNYRIWSLYVDSLSLYSNLMVFMYI